MRPETGWFRTESGVILEMDLPLPEPIAQRVHRGEIVQVANADGDPMPEPKPEGSELPEVSDAEIREAAKGLAEELSKALDLNTELVAKVAELESKLADAEASLVELAPLRLPETPDAPAEPAPKPKTPRKAS